MDEKKSASVYDFSYFEPQTEGTAAVKQEQRSRAAAPARRATENSSVSPAFKKALLIVAVGLVMVACLLGVRCKSVSLNSQIEEANKALKIAMSENVRLNAELNSMISVEKIEDYAENVLGMTKIEAYQITYLDLSEGDEVVVSGDKSVHKGDSFSEKLQEIFAYIF